MGRARPKTTSSIDSLVRLLDQIGQRSGVSRGQAFEDNLHAMVCALSGGAMEDEYVQLAKRHSRGKRGQRGIDLFAQFFGELVSLMEDNPSEIKDPLGDLFEQAITYGEAGQFLSPMSLCRLMARLELQDVPADLGRRPSIADCCCGSGRMLLAAAEVRRDAEFHGQDVDLRCVRMTALNLALRNLRGIVIWGNTLAVENRLAYQTGFNGRGLIRLVPPAAMPADITAVKQSGRKRATRRAG